jgi:hypothetical protein
MKKLFVVLGTSFMIASPSFAQTVFPKLEAGIFPLRAQAAPMTFDAQGDPLTAPTLAISLHKEESPTEWFTCIPVDAEGVASFTIVLANDGLRNVIRGRAHETEDCKGLESSPSSNRAIIFFNGPEDPKLQPADENAS